jgi:hypothetical protein
VINVTFDADDGASTEVSRRSTTRADSTRYRNRPARVERTISSPISNSRKIANCVSRCAEMAQLPFCPGMAVPSTCPGPKASVRPLAPARTIADAR